MSAASSVAKRKPKLIDIMPAEVVEGMLGETLREIKASVDIWYECPAVSGMTGVQHGRATGLIVSHLVAGAVDFLSHHSDASLNPKHRAVRHVLVEMSERMSRNPPGDGCDMERLAGDMVGFLTAYHLCLSESSDTKTRRAAREAFCNGEESIN